ncbi:hypothetical protein Sdia_60950 [Streptomyces diastaticus subsp. diastaticus]|uniref:Uncharacterized protein n=1 Tax=Streptomyces diastaticus subsp. diastaticus TaxID=68040 RepID=A0ABQ1CYD2_STRDI|nr:hypothetical protein Sdia_60950 [Streptomyces diastaticus subsp. diastaticus]
MPGLAGAGGAVLAVLETGGEHVGPVGAEAFGKAGAEALALVGGGRGPDADSGDFRGVGEGPAEAVSEPFPTCRAD